MKKAIALFGLVFVATQASAECLIIQGVNLCYEPLDAGFAKILNKTKVSGDVNGDGYLDIVAKENAGGINNRVVVYLGYGCNGNTTSSLCFRQPHLTSIYPVKGIELSDVDNDGNDELIVRDGDDKIKLYGLYEELPAIPNTPSYVVSVLGTYGLTAASYTSSSIYPDGAGGYETAGAFDGYRMGITNPVTSGATTRYGHGTWTSASGNPITNQWLDVNFTTNTSVASFDLYAKSGFVSRIPKNIIVQVSYDGVNYVDFENILTTNTEVQTITLSNPTPFAKHFRLFMLNTHEGGLYMQIDELLLKGWVGQ